MNPKFMAFMALGLGLAIAAAISFGPIVLLADPTTHWALKGLAAATCTMSLATIVMFARVAWHLWEDDYD